MEPVKHSVNGRIYEITVTQSDHDIEVATFYEGKRVGRYSISLENAEHVQTSHLATGDQGIDRHRQGRSGGRHRQGVP